MGGYLFKFCEFSIERFVCFYKWWFMADDKANENTKKRIQERIIKNGARKDPEKFYFLSKRKHLSLKREYERKKAT